MRIFREMTFSNHLNDEYPFFANCHSDLATSLGVHNNLRCGVSSAAQEPRSARSSIDERSVSDARTSSAPSFMEREAQLRRGQKLYGHPYTYLLRSGPTLVLCQFNPPRLRREKGPWPAPRTGRHARTGPRPARAQRARAEAAMRLPLLGSVVAQKPRGRVLRIYGKTRRFSLDLQTEPGGTRTHDLRIKSPLLYRLSYRL